MSSHFQSREQAHQRNQHCLRLLAEHAGAQIASILEHNWQQQQEQMQEKVQKQQMQEKMQENNCFQNCFSKSLVSLQTFCDSIVQHCRTTPIDCEPNLLNNRVVPDPIKRHASWRETMFIEYVSAKVVQAQIDRQSKKVCLTVWLFPLVSKGYVPDSSVSKTDDASDYRITFPSEHNAEWVQSQLPKIDFFANFSSSNCTLVATLLHHQANGQQRATKFEYCATKSTVSLLGARACLEYQVNLDFL